MCACRCVGPLVDGLLACIDHIDEIGIESHVIFYVARSLEGIFITPGNIFRALAGYHDRPVGCVALERAVSPMLAALQQSPVQIVAGKIKDRRQARFVHHAHLAAVRHRDAVQGDCHTRRVHVEGETIVLRLGADGLETMLFLRRAHFRLPAAFNRPGPGPGRRSSPQRPRYRQTGEADSVRPDCWGLPPWPGAR